MEEVENLNKSGLSWKRMSEIGLEYKLVALYLQNKLTKPELIERMRIETAQYAKRQMTWFKKSKDVVWFTMSNVEGFGSKDMEKIEEKVEKFLYKK